MQCAASRNLRQVLADRLHYMNHVGGRSVDDNGGGRTGVLLQSLAPLRHWLSPMNDWQCCCTRQWHRANLLGHMMSFHWKTVFFQRTCCTSSRCDLQQLWQNKCKLRRQRSFSVARNVELIVRKRVRQSTGIIINLIWRASSQSQQRDRSEYLAFNLTESNVSIRFKSSCRTPVRQVLPA